MTSEPPGGQARARPFEAERPRLRALAFRMLGSLADAEDVVQEAWLRRGRVEAERQGEVADLPAWLATVTARLALDTLRSRRRRGEEPLGAEGDAPLEATAIFVAGAWLALQARWLDAGARLPPQEVDAMFRRLVTQGMSDAAHHSRSARSPRRSQQAHGACRLDGHWRKGSCLGPTRGDRPAGRLRPPDGAP